MRLKYLTLFFFLISISSFSQEKVDDSLSKRIKFSTKVRDAFQSGEWFRFRIHYGIFNASFATLKLDEVQRNGKTLLHASGIGRTTGLARLFFKVDDYYDSYFEKGIVSPVHFIRNINEGGYTKNLTIDFDKENGKALVHNIKKKTKKSFDTAPYVQDMMSAFYFLRNHFDVDHIQPGEYVDINMFFDESNYKFRMKFLTYDVINTKFGKVECLKFRPYVQSGRVFKGDESLTIWVTNDKNKIPIRIEASLSVGSLDADLDAFSGLKHPFKILVDD